MTLSFTGVVYFPLSIALIFLSYRFYKERGKEENSESLLYALIFFILSLVCFTGVLAGTVFSLDPSGIRLMLIISSFFLAFVSAFIVQLTIEYIAPQKSPWFLSGLAFLYGIMVSVITIKAQIRPALEESGGIYWGMPFYLSVMRFLIYFLTITPLIWILIVKKIKPATNQDVKLKYVMLTTFFSFALVVVIVDFIIEPVFSMRALLSELAIIFLVVMIMISYFIYLERVISRSERRFRRMVENMNDMICLLSTDGTIRYSNPAQQETLGFTNKELLGKQFMDFVHEMDKDLVAKYIQNKDNFEENDRLEFRLKGKKGGFVWIETAGYFFLDSYHKADENDILVLASRDITERKKNEQELAKSSRDKQILISEIYHRTKNNLAIVLSLLNIHLMYAKNVETRDTLYDVKGRIYAISLLLQILYTSKPILMIDFKKYLELLTKHLMGEFRIKTKENIFFDLDTVYLEFETATACGLIVNEILTNLLKTNAPTSNSKPLFLAAKKQSKRMVISIFYENGQLPPVFSQKDPDNLSMILLQKLAEQIDASLVIDEEKGCKFVLEFDYLS